LGPVAACCGGRGGAEELADPGPGEFLVPGVVDGLGQELLSLGDQAGQGVQPDGGVAEPVGCAEPGELAGRLGEDLEAVLAGGGCGQLARRGPRPREITVDSLRDTSVSCCETLMEVPMPGPDRFVDAHVHLLDVPQGWYGWIESASDYGLGDDTSPLNNPYLLDDYLRDTGALRPSKIVHVAASTTPHHVDETRWLTSVGVERGLPTALVVHIDHHAELDQIAAEMDTHSESPLVRGIRILEDVDYTSEHGAGILNLLARRGWVYDEVASPGAIGRSADAAARFSEVPFILEHAGWPHSDDPEHFALWKKEVADFAAVDTARCKLSGLGMHQHIHDIERQRPFLEHCLEVFGPDRCMVGSNFPIDRLYGDFAGLWAVYHAVFGGLSDDERAALFAGTAEAAYGI
jgi:predicted TIM-barrel fold metal-dependent hydrolase